MRKAEMQQQALSNAVNSESFANYPLIFAGFMEKGIPESEIKPRENVFTFHAWRALGRSVKKGEHGVKVATFRPVIRKNKETGEDQVIGKAPHYTTVFHISQTVELATVK